MNATTLDINSISDDNGIEGCVGVEGSVKTRREGEWKRYLNLEGIKEDESISRIIECKFGFHEKGGRQIEPIHLGQRESHVI